MYSTAYITGADWNDTRFFDEGFDKIIMEARAELDQDKRAQMYRDAATKVRDDGGLILPMFNDFLDAADALVEELTAAGQRAMAVQADVSVRQQVNLTI